MSKDEFMEHIEQCTECVELEHEEQWDCFVNAKASYTDFLLDSMKEEQ